MSLRIGAPDRLVRPVIGVPAPALITGMMRFYLRHALLKSSMMRSKTND